MSGENPTCVLFLSHICSSVGKSRPKVKETFTMFVKGDHFFYCNIHDSLVSL